MRPAEDIKFFTQPESTELLPIGSNSSSVQRPLSCKCLFKKELVSAVGIEST
jgi:hypothetical protein